jgi:hypothetical protein
MPLAAIETELLLFTGVEGADEYTDVVDVVSYAPKVMTEGPSDEARRAVPTIMGGNM